MSKLKNIIRQLTEKDFQSIYDMLMDSNADKSAALLKFFKERQLSDNKIMSELDVNPNAYYTLRSRLNEKIEEYFVQAMESPKADILKKVSNVNDIVYTKKKTIVVATLKKLEKELVDYDLTSELISIYKNLKKFHINSPEHYHYSQLYNKHIAYTLAIDKAEDLLGDYFKKYGHYYLSNEETTKAELGMLVKEIENVSRLYQSHRLFVYKNALGIFHHLFIDSKYIPEDSESIEDSFEKIDKIFSTYSSDVHYHHLKIVFDFLKFHFYKRENDIKKSDSYFYDMNENASIFLSNYSFYTFPAFFLSGKMEKSKQLGTTSELVEENAVIFSDYEPDPLDVPKYVMYYTYVAMGYFYAGKYDMAAKKLNILLNEITFKKYQETQVEIKTLLALQYCLMKDDDLFNQLMSSIQRQIRMLGKKKLDHIVAMSKAMKAALSNNTVKMRAAKIKMQFNRINLDKIPYFTTIRYITFNEKLIKEMSE